MPDPAWPSSPPEANYLRLAGPGAAGCATTVASGAAWQALTVANEVASGMSTLNTAVTAVNFEGVGGTGSATAITGLNTALQLLAGWAQEKPPIAAGAVSAYQTALTSMIPAEVCLANRAEQAANVAMNPLVLGALTPAIVALDAQYFGEFWPHNASTGVAYGAALTALAAALTVPPPFAPPSATAGAPAAAAAAVAQTVGQAAAGEALRESAQATTMPGDAAAVPAGAVGGLGGFASSIGQPLQAAMGTIMGMFQAPVQAVSGLSAIAQSMPESLDTESLGQGQVPVAMLGGAGASIAGAQTAGSAVANLPISAGGGGIGSAAGAIPGAGLTSYTRPSSSFAPPASGRPAGLKTGLLNATDFHGPTIAGGPMPLAPNHSAVQVRSNAEKDVVPLARVIIGAETRRGQPV